MFTALDPKQGQPIKAKIRAGIIKNHVTQICHFCGLNFFPKGSHIRQAEETKPNHQAPKEPESSLAPPAGCSSCLSPSPAKTANENERKLRPRRCKDESNVRWKSLCSREYSRTHAYEYGCGLKTIRRFMLEPQATGP